MASKLFSTKKPTPVVNTFNKAGGTAYQMSDEQALAQLVCTGALGDTFYISAEQQLDDLLSVASRCSATYLAQAAIYGRQHAFMKDTPAILLACLASLSKVDDRAREILRKTFFQVVDNTRMLRNFVQIIRSGKTGRRSLGTLPKKLVANWLNSQSVEQLFRNSTGNDPSLADVVKLSRPLPSTPEYRAFYGWLIGKEVEGLPQVVRDYEAFKTALAAGENPSIPSNVPPEMIQGLPGMGIDQWTQLARTGNWHWTRMNLNTLIRHGALKSLETMEIVAQRLCDSTIIKKVNVFPYQLLTTFQNADVEEYPSISRALHAATEFAVSNVPEIAGDVIVAVDTSGSMQTPVTGARRAANGKAIPASKTTCLEVAALVAAAIVRKNPTAGVIQFDTQANWFRPNKNESVLALAKRIARRGGGTAISSALQLILETNTKVGLLVIVSDNESWADFSPVHRGKTPTAALWEQIVQKNPGAKLICLDLVPNTTTQVPNCCSGLNIGGFSDKVFDLIAKFNNNQLHRDGWVQEIKNIPI
jgi:60 kDa SS-A/Ro ribonucleoprotein